MANKQPRRLFNFYFDTLIDKVEKDEHVPEFEEVNNIKQKPIKTEPRQKKTKMKIQKENQVSNIRVKSKLEQLIFKANNNQEIISSSEQRERRKKSKKKQKAVGNVRLNIFNIIQKTNKGQEVKQEQLILSQPHSSDNQIEQNKKIEEKKQNFAIAKKKQNIKTQPIIESKKYLKNQEKDRIDLKDVHIEPIDEDQQKHYKNMRIRKAKILQNTKADQTLTKKLQKIYNYRFQNQEKVSRQDQNVLKNNVKQRENKQKNYHLALPKIQPHEKQQISNTSLRLPAIDHKSNKNKHLNKSIDNDGIKSPKSIQFTPQKTSTIQYQRYNGKNVFQSPPVNNKWNRSIMDIPPNQKLNFSQNDDAAKRKAELIKQSRMKYIQGSPTDLKNQFKSYKIGRFSQKVVQQEQD